MTLGMLHFELHGTPSDAPPLVIAHGLFGSARNWRVIAKRLSDERQVIAVDMRNHGASPWIDSHSYADLSGDLAEVIQAHGGKADLLGHSMGGKSAMMLALHRSDILRRLIVADIAPVAYPHSQSHLIAAMRSVDVSQISKRSDAEAQLQAHIQDPTVRAFLLQSLDLGAHKWRLNLDVLDRDMSGITGWPDPTGEVDLPCLFLLGAESDYMTDQGRRAAKTHFPSARFAKIPSTGHWLHAEAPRAFEDTVRIFLNA